MSFSQKSVFATLPRTTRGQPTVIGGDPKGKNFLYGHKNSVIIRDLENPVECDIYTEHAKEVSVAKYCPSGFYIASGDASGKVRIWDTTQKEHLLKYEYQPLAGCIKDLAWDPDNKRLVVAGEGREQFGHVFLWDTGSSVGTITGHSKSLNSVDYRAARPFRIVTASEDQSLCFFHGPPFKFVNSIQLHSNFVNAVRYAPDGSKFISAGADKQAYIFDGATGEKIGQLGGENGAHKGGIYGLCFSPDSSKVVTVSGDKTAKIWNADNGEMISECVFGNNVEDMQAGCLWQKDVIITLSVSGFINYMDPNDFSKPKRIVKGHNQAITALGVTLDRTKIVTADFTGKCCVWDADCGEAEVLQGKKHGSQITDLLVIGDSLITCGMDDILKISSLQELSFSSNDLKMPSQPKSISALERDLILVACNQHIVIVRNSGGCAKITAVVDVTYQPSSVSLHTGLNQVAVGGDDQKVHIYKLSGDTLSEDITLPHTGQIKCVQYSPDGAWLAAGDSNRKIKLYNSDYKGVAEWGYHTATVTTLDFSPNSRRLASGSVDTKVMIWSVDSPDSCIKISAHPQYDVTKVRWLDDNVVVSVSRDSNVKQWIISE